MNFRDKKRRERRAAIAQQRMSVQRVAAGLPAKPAPVLAPRRGPSLPKVERVLGRSRRTASQEPKATVQTVRKAGRQPFVYAPTRDAVIDRSPRQAPFSKLKEWRDRAAKASVADMAKRHQIDVCKERPADSRKGGGGRKRAFVPWCKE